jgi:hypothetical protein
MPAALKEVFAPSLSRKVKFGRRRPVAHAPCLKLRHYLGANLPSPPASVSYTTSASASLASIFGNDTLGDCVIAALMHLVGVWTGNAGSIFIPTPAQVIAMYSAIGGYVPGDPSTDNGCDMQTAMNWIVANGYPNGDKPVGYVAIDASNFEEVCTAIWLFEGIDLGMALPDAWINPMPSSSGFVWDVAGAPDQNNGHSIMAAGYQSTGQAGVTIDTWAMLGLETEAALAQYATAANGGELYVLLSPDMIAKAATKAPNGFDWQSLVADFDDIGGTVPAPTPAPTPQPTPTPVTAATLAQAQTWGANGINAGRFVMTKAQAIASMNAGLAAGFAGKS